MSSFLDESVGGSSETPRCEPWREDSPRLRGAASRPPLQEKSFAR